MVDGLTQMLNLNGVTATLASVPTEAFLIGLGMVFGLIALLFLFWCLRSPKRS